MKRLNENLHVKVIYGWRISKPLETSDQYEYLIAHLDKKYYLDCIEYESREFVIFGIEVGNTDIDDLTIIEIITDHGINKEDLILKFQEIFGGFLIQPRVILYCYSF